MSSMIPYVTDFYTCNVFVETPLQSQDYGPLMFSHSFNPTIPMFHVAGHYMFVDASTGSSYSKANMETPWMYEASSTCMVKFWVHMFGDGKNLTQNAKQQIMFPFTFQLTLWLLTYRYMFSYVLLVFDCSCIFVAFYDIEFIMIKVT